MAPPKNQDLRCKFCEKTFKRKLNLHQHQSKNVCKSGEKCFKCPECSNSFDRKPYLRKHMHRMHECESPKKNICCVHCSSKFSTNSNYVRHIRKFHPEKKNSESPQRLETNGSNEETGGIGEGYVYFIFFHSIHSILFRSEF